MHYTPNDSQRFDLIHELVTKQLEGSATPAEQNQLQEAITSDREIRREYVRYMQEVVHISSRLVRPPASQTDTIPKSEILKISESPSSSTNPTSPSPRLALASRPSRSIQQIIAVIAIAAALLLTIGLSTWNALRLDQQHRDADIVARLIPNHANGSGGPKYGEKVATLIQTTNVTWDSQHKSIGELSRVSIGQKLCIHQGSLKLVFDSGVEALVLAPCLIEIQERDRVYCSYGRITAKAADSGNGFIIDTPVARVTDLGTEFGVAISDSGETEVAVFEGEVDVELGSTNQRSEQMSPSKREHLVQGQATLVGHDGQSRRVFSVDNQRLPGVRDLAPLHSRSPVISAVRDNLSDQLPESRMFYRIVQAGFREDSRAFVDRDHEWNGLTETGVPEELIGADYVMPFNDDKFVEDLQVQVTIAQPSTVYVFFSDNALVPQWLSDEFEDTGLDLGLDEAANRYKPKKKVTTGPGASIDSIFSIWKRNIDKPQELRLGSFERPADVLLGYNMYGIAAVAKEAASQPK
ncbi:FecR family protein [Neorhodopirellula lusitana]|uniref:FecR family protein n=1 Tax=Neorhodopirellula lusitana TaxID=445327 RepID=A0ABY1Q5Z9_9BACT|nr:FecR family protein [Neorhodopirellula lusitana]SMP58178.1 FecR family protein [Neorhodopirellula lusitana]